MSCAASSIFRTALKGIALITAPLVGFCAAGLASKYLHTSWMASSLSERSFITFAPPFGLIVSERGGVRKEGEMEFRVQYFFDGYSEMEKKLDEVLRAASRIEKEHNVNCTLFEIVYDDRDS